MLITTISRVLNQLFAKTDGHDSRSYDMFSERDIVQAASSFYLLTCVIKVRFFFWLGCFPKKVT